MRRDVNFYVEASVEQVYKAYLSAATNEPFERDCTEEPYHTISFGVNYSFKYNMNGGACNIHFMPYGTGTAVNIRFSLAQAAGARCEKYAANLNEAMQRYLPVTPQAAQFDVEAFADPKNQLTPQKLEAAQQETVQQEAAQQKPEPQPVLQAPVDKTFCANCGKPLAPGSRFCAQCGTPVSQKRVCAKCNAPAAADAVFCINCGTRL